MHTHTTAFSPPPPPAVVLSVTLAVGASRLADHKAIVTRISAIEELAGMNMLCSDKTGTLTLNKLSVVRDELLLYGGKSLDELVMAAARASRTANMDASEGDTDFGDLNRHRRLDFHINLRSCL